MTQDNDNILAQLHASRIREERLEYNLLDLRSQLSEALTSKRLAEVERDVMANDLYDLRALQRTDHIAWKQRQRRDEHLLHARHSESSDKLMLEASNYLLRMMVRHPWPAVTGYQNAMPTDHTFRIEVGVSVICEAMVCGNLVAVKQNIAATDLVLLDSTYLQLDLQRCEVSTPYGVNYSMSGMLYGHLLEQMAITSAFEYQSVKKKIEA